MRSNASYVMGSRPIDTYENIAFQQLRWRAVNLKDAHLYIGVNKHVELKATSKNKPTQQSCANCNAFGFIIKYNVQREV